MDQKEMMELKITKTKLKNFQEFNIRFEEAEEKKNLQSFFYSEI